MIKDMRDSVASWPIRIILLILIVSFISFYGWGGGQGGLKSGEVASVNGEPILSRDFSFRYQNYIQRFIQQGRLTADVPEMIQSMIQQQLLTSMIYDKIKSKEAKKLSLSPPDDLIKDRIREQFGDKDGKFDFKFYKDFLRNQLGKSPGQFEDEEREALRASLFEQVMMETAIVSDLELKEAYRRNNEKISLTYLRLNEKNTQNARPKTEKPSVKDLESYFQEHSEEFKSPEKRNLKVAYVEKKDFENGDFSSQAQEIFQSNSSDARVKTLTTGLITFDDTAKPLTSAETTEILNASINLEEGKQSVLVSRDGGKAFSITLLEVVPSEVIPLEKIKSKVEEKYLAEMNEKNYRLWVENSWKNIVDQKQSLESFAKKRGLTSSSTDTFPYVATGAIPGLGTSADLMSEAFRLDEKNPYPSKPFKVGADDVFAVVTKKIEPDWIQFEVEKTNLAAALRQETAQRRYFTWVDKIQDRYKIKRMAQDRSRAGLPAQ